MQQYRTPSLIVADHTPSGVRRRSGGKQKGPSSDDRCEREDDVGGTSDRLYRHQSIRLVGRTQCSPPLPPPPTISTNLVPHPPTPEYRASQGEREDVAASPFSAIPLTPRPDGPSRGTSESSLESTNTYATDIPRLPTPDFGNIASFTPDIETEAKTAALPSLRSLLPRGLSFISSSVPPLVALMSSTATTPAPSRPQTLRSGKSEGSVRTTWSSSTGSSSSVDSGHRALIASIGTTDKFTHKWPKPQSLRYLETRAGNNTGIGLEEAAAVALEDGEGLGMNRLERWTSFKWCLLFSVSMVFSYGAAGLVCAIAIWFRTWDHADVMYVADSDILILVTLAASILIFTALVGLTGVLLNSRPILAVYSLLLWPALASLLAVGYLSYKRVTFSLDHKLNLSWSQYYTPLGRLLIQDSLRCCGFYSALHEATPSKRCYPRTPLPGCKGKLYRFERDNLGVVWSAAFALVPLHLVNIAVALLCANHITRTFGKGITPKRYRLSSADVRADAEKILTGIRQAGLGNVKRPELSRASLSGVFRPDREDAASSLKDYYDQSRVKDRK